MPSYAASCEIGVTIDCGPSFDVALERKIPIRKPKRALTIQKPIEYTIPSLQRVETDVADEIGTTSAMMNAYKTLRTI